MNSLIENAEFSVERVRADVDHICTEIPSRLAGSENGKRMAQFSCDGLRAAGVEAQVYTLPGLVSFPERGELRLLSPAGQTVIANTLGHSVQTAPAGVTGDLIDVGPGAYADFEGKDVRGKIVLTELSYHPGRHEKQRIAAEKGAVGCVMMNWGHPDSTLLPFGSVKPAWGNPTPQMFRDEMAELPCIGISRVDGLALREQSKSGSVRVELHANVENVWRPVHVTVGELRSDQSEDFVIVGGHQDSWEGPQATDNAAGSAVILELARFFAKHRGQLRRGISFGFWTAHETGTMIGSTWFADHHWDRLRAHGVAYLQIDQPAVAGTTRWASVSNSELRAFQEGIDGRLPGSITRTWRRTEKIGDASFFGVGVPMFTGRGAYTPDELKATGNANLGWWHHSLENTIDKLQWDAMGLHLKMYASYVWELCTAPVIPTRFSAVADEIVNRLGELAPAGVAIGLDSALALARQLRQTIGQLDARADEVNQRCLDAQPGSEQEATKLNETIKRMSRMLLPMASTAKGSYGQDPYSYTPQTTVLPSLYEVSRFAALPEGEARWLLETHLVRERNRVADTLRDAIALSAGSL